MGRSRFKWPRSTSRARVIWLAAATLVLAVGLHNAGTALVVSAPVSNPEAIVMLASHEWERLPAVAGMARRYPDALVLLTVPRSPSYWNCFRCSDRAEWLSREGVDTGRIVELRGAGNTFGEAEVVKTCLQARGVKRLMVVTSPYHARRSLTTFRSVLAGTGIDVGLEPATGHSNATPASWWRYDVDRDYVAYEWAALAWYSARYGVRPF